MKKLIFLLILIQGSTCITWSAEMDLYKSMLIGDTPSIKEGITLTWIGTAGVLISDGQTGILIDPYVSRVSMARIAFRMPLVPRQDLVRSWVDKLGKNNIQAVIVSHSHFDHSMDAPYFAREAGAQMIGTESTLNIGRGAGLREDGLKLAKPGQPIRIGRFTVQFFESDHGLVFGRIPDIGFIEKPLVPPAYARDYKLGGVFGILISHPAGTILHHGSAGFIPGMYDTIRADLVILGIAARGDTAEYVKEVPLRVKANTVIPVHFDNFFKSLDKNLSILPVSVNFKEFCDTAGRYSDSFTLRTLPIGKPVRVLPVNR
jgi:L-ascorbate metabolism protein UlaG (beta-lactamase superfamily)